MIAVIFELTPDPDHKDQYLEIAQNLKSLLEDIPGFISVERFQSLTNPEKLLSLSFFENEESVQKWRNTIAHRNAQALGRDKLFTGYRLRVCQVMRDYSLDDREDTPDDSRHFHNHP